MILQTLPEQINVVDSLKNTTEYIIEEIKTHPDQFWQNLGKDALDFGLKVFAAFAIYIVGAWFIRKVRKLMARGFRKRNTEKTLASFLSSMVSIVLTILLIVVTIGTLGVNTTSLAALLAAGGMAIGMALSGTVQNFAGGMMILFFKPFKVGDYIVAQGFSGTVMAVTMVNTKLQTVDNRTIMIPNGALFNGNIENVSALPLRRVDWTISVEYDSDADKCISAIMDILKSDGRILDSSTSGAADPFVALLSLNENDISFTARAWTRSENYWPVFFDINKEIYTGLPKLGFSFAYPHMDVTVTDRK